MSAARRTGAARLGTPTLTAADWAEAALQLIAEKGLRGLTVSTLANRLGVTKGSFYWHFTGRDALLGAALARWEQRATSEAVKALDAIPDYHQRLQLILDASSQPPRARSLYAALAEGAEEPLVKAALTRVGVARIEYLDFCYRKLGLSAGEARARAVFAYAAYRGMLQLAHETPSALPADWSSYGEIVKTVLLPGASRRAQKSNRTPRPAG